MPLVQWMPDRNGFSCQKERSCSSTRCAYRSSWLSAQALASSVRCCSRAISQTCLTLPVCSSERWSTRNA